MTNLGLNRGGQRGCFLVSSETVSCKKPLKIVVAGSGKDFTVQSFLPASKSSHIMAPNVRDLLALSCVKIYFVFQFDKKIEFSSRKENTILKPKETSKSIKLETLLSLFSARSKKSFLKIICSINNILLFFKKVLGVP